MKVSKKSDYALRALVSLSLQPGILLSIRHLANVNDVPKRFLEHIMLDLKNAGWVNGLPGRDGGYTLAVPPEKLTIGRIIRYFDGMIAPLSCVSVEKYEPCTQESVCRFRRIFLDIRNHSAKILDGISLANLAQIEPVTTKEMQDVSFINGSGI